MDFIISFFRNIDGVTYYIILIVNTILIFAIIGYLGEKSNEQLMKLEMNTTSPDVKSDQTNLNTVNTVAPSHNNATIPKIAATQASNVQGVPLSSTNQVVSPVPINQMNSQTPAINQSASQPVTQVINQVSTPSVPVGNTSAIPAINQVSQPIVRPQDNTVNPSEKHQPY